MASYPSDQARPQGARRLAAAGAAALIFLAGMATRGALADGSKAGEGAPPVTRSAGLPPSDQPSDAPPAFTRDRAGARTAAIAYAATLPQRLLYLEPAAAEAAVRAVAADASEPTLVADVMAGLAAAREPLATGTGATWWAVSPLASKVEAFSRDRARVSVWVMRVLSRQGVVVPQTSWLIETVELVWEDGDWRLWSDSSRAGPTPVLDGSDLPATAAELDIELTGFELVGLPGGS